MCCVYMQTDSAAKCQCKWQSAVFRHSAKTSQLDIRSVFGECIVSTRTWNFLPIYSSHESLLFRRRYVQWQRNRRFFFQESCASSAHARSSNSFVRTFDWNEGAFVGGRMLEVLRCYPHWYDLLHSDCEDPHQTQNACRREWWLALVENMAICLSYIDTFFRRSWTTNCMTQFQRCVVRADGASPKLNKAFIFMILQSICALWKQLNWTVHRVICKDSLSTCEDGNHNKLARTNDTFSTHREKRHDMFHFSITFLKIMFYSHLLPNGFRAVHNKTNLYSPNGALCFDTCC